MTPTASPISAYQQHTSSGLVPPSAFPRSPDNARPDSRVGRAVATSRRALADLRNITSGEAVVYLDGVATPMSAVWSYHRWATEAIAAYQKTTLPSTEARRNFREARDWLDLKGPRVDQYLGAHSKANQAVKDADAHVSEAWDEYFRRTLPELERLYPLAARAGPSSNLRYEFDLVAARAIELVGRPVS